MDTIVAALFAWLGLYLLRRDSRDIGLILGGTGSIMYGLSVASGALDLPDTVEFGLALLAAAIWFTAVGMKLSHLRETWHEGPRSRAAGLIGVAILQLSLSVTGLLMPFEVLSRDFLLLLIGVDGLLLAIGIAAFDAFAQGESLRRDMLVSGARSGAMGVIFGGQAVALDAPISAKLTLTVSAALVPLLAAPAQTWLDRLIFSSRVQKARADLRDAAEALPRAAEIPSDFAALDDAEFAKLTRRALSSLNDLTKLSASALLNLPQIDARLRESGASDNVLERAAVLKALLSESVERLKPRGQGDFGLSDAWRHYNALYWPYIAGLKPYSRRMFESPSGAEGEVLAWFQSQVPERTLHNWQNAAARLIARDLYEGLT